MDQNNMKHKIQMYSDCQERIKLQQSNRTSDSGYPLVQHNFHQSINLHPPAMFFLISLYL